MTRTAVELPNGVLAGPVQAEEVCLLARSQPWLFAPESAGCLGSFHSRRETSSGPSPREQGRARGSPTGVPFTVPQGPRLGPGRVTGLAGAQYLSLLPRAGEERCQPVADLDAAEILSPLDPPQVGGRHEPFRAGCALPGGGDEVLYPGLSLGVIKLTNGGVGRMVVPAG